MERAIFQLSGCEVRADSGRKTLRGYALLWDEPSVDLGGYREKFLRGSVSESVKHDVIKSFWSHDSSKPLASTTNGTLQLSEDDVGLRFTIVPPKTTWGADAIESIARGDIDSMSFAFQVQPSGERWKNGVREIHKAKLLEISPVADPAYPETSISVRRRGNMKDKNEILRHLGRLVEDAVKIRDRGTRENRALTKGERNEITEIAEEHDAMVPQLNRFGISHPLFSDVGLDGLEKRYNEFARPPIIPDDGEKPSNGGFSYRENPNARDTRTSFNRYLAEGPHALNDGEYRALQADSDAGGGYLVVPTEVVQEFLKSLDDEVFILQLAKILQVGSADSLGIPELKTDISDSDWTSELKTGAEDTAMNFGKRELHPSPLAKRIKVSNKLLRLSVLNPEQIVRDRMAYKFGVTLEKAFITGTGAQQPLGVFTASADGVDTSRDVSTGNTTTSIGADGLIEALGSLKPQYLRNARWIFHRDAIKQIRKLKDGNGQYLWQAGLSGFAPSTILDQPYFVSKYVPNTFTTGLYVGIIGDFRFYWIAIALNLAVQRLVEVYAETNQTGFIGRMELDAMPVIGEAFTRVTLA